MGKTNLPFTMPDVIVALSSAALLPKRLNKIPSETPARSAISAVVARGPFSINTARAAAMRASSVIVGGRDMISIYSLIYGTNWLVRLAVASPSSHFVVD